MATYPPEPWYLGGSLLVSAFLVPAAELPAIDIPDGRRPLRLGGKVVVGTAFANYVPGGVLHYNELLVSVPSVFPPRVTIPHIWVDSEASRTGGRQLWGIPKELETFERTEKRDGVTVSLSSVARLHARFRGPLLPGMRQLPLPTLQSWNGGRILSHNRIVGRFSGLSTTWTFASNGPLGYLAGRRPIFSAAIRDASIIFGMDVKR